MSVSATLRSMYVTSWPTIDANELQMDYKDSALYIMKYRQCMTRGLSMIKQFFVTNLRVIQSQIKDNMAGKVILRP